MKPAENNAIRFEAELILGHKGVTVALVPFDPEQQWNLKPVRLAGRRHGWVITASANGAEFDGYIGERWNRFFIIIEKELRDAAEIEVGDTVKMNVHPTSNSKAFTKAFAQSKVTTQPKVARSDATAIHSV